MVGHVNRVCLPGIIITSQIIIIMSSAMAIKVEDSALRHALQKAYIMKYRASLVATTIGCVSVYAYAAYYYYYMCLPYLPCEVNAL